MKMDINNLINERIINFGQKARNNPQTTDFPSFCLGVANKDYPAMTPHLWNTVFEHLGLVTRNIRFFADPIHIQQILQAFKTDPHYIGGDVGVGFKDKAPLLIDELDPLARQMQAINLIVKTPDGNLRGYNTDGLGYAVSLEAEFKKQGTDLRGKKVVLIGAGGTSNAIAFALADKKANLVILNRTVEKAKNLTERLNQYFGKIIANYGGLDQVRQQVMDADAIVSVIDDPKMSLDKISILGRIQLPLTEGMIQDNILETRKLMEKLPKNVIISDVMLRESDTATIALAKELKLPTLDGFPMVLNQAVEAFWLVNAQVLHEKQVSKEQIAQIMAKAANL